jgi:bacteriorhodopsin
MKRFIISAILMGFVTVASAQKTRCVKWSWYNIGGVQKTVCLLWASR